MKSNALIISAKTPVYFTFNLSISLHQKAIFEKQPVNTLSYRTPNYFCRYPGVAFNNMKKGGPTLRKELGDINYLEAHPEVCKLFQDVGCYRFCEKIQGSHQQVAEAFSLSFDGSKVS